MIKINKNPSPRELFWFGAMLAPFFALLGAVAIWRFGSVQAAYVLWTVGATAAVAFFLIKPLRRPLYLGWMYAAFPIGWTVTHVVLGLIFYLVFTPIGLMMRVVGRDPMHRRFDRSAKSYWIKRDTTFDPARYFRQF